MNARPDDAKFCYISRRPCGCISMLIVDVPGDGKWVASEVAKLIRQGRSVERISIVGSRLASWKCPQCEKPKPAPAVALGGIGSEK